MRTIKGASTELLQIDQVIQIKYIPSITVGRTCNEGERTLLSLSPKLVELGIPTFAEFCQEKHEN